MALKYVNGYQAPRIMVINNNTVVKDYYFSFVGSDGLIEQYEDNAIIQELESGDILVKPKGFHIYWSIDYKEYSPSTNTLQIGEIWDYYQLGYTLKLWPRKETVVRSFDVTFNKGFNLGNMKHGIDAIGNRLIELELRTTKKQTSLNLINVKLKS